MPRERLIRLILGGLGMAWLVTSGCSTAQDKYFLSKASRASVMLAAPDTTIQKVAILPFTGPTAFIGASVSDMCVTELMRAGRYELVERSQMQAVLGETELALAGVSDARAVEAGNLLEADGVIMGHVDEYDTVMQRGTSYPVVALSMRLIDCQTSRLIWSASLSAQARMERSALSEQARAVVHEMISGLYRQWRSQPQPAAASATGPRPRANAGMNTPVGH